MSNKLTNTSSRLFNVCAVSIIYNSLRNNEFVCILFVHIAKIIGILALIAY